MSIRCLRPNVSINVNPCGSSYLTKDENDTVGESRASERNTGLNAKLACSLPEAFATRVIQHCLASSNQ